MYRTVEDPESLQKQFLPPPPPLLRNLPINGISIVTKQKFPQIDDFYSNCHPGESSDAEIINETKTKRNPLLALQENASMYIAFISQTKTIIEILEQSMAENEKNIQKCEEQEQNYLSNIESNIAEITGAINELDQKYVDVYNKCEKIKCTLKKRAKMRDEVFDPDTILLKDFHESIQEMKLSIQRLSETLNSLECERTEALTKKTLKSLQHEGRKIETDISIYGDELLSYENTLEFIKDLISEELMTPRYKQYALNHSLEFNQNDIFDLFFKVNMHYFQTLIVSQYSDRTINDCEFKIDQMFDLKKINIDSTIESLVNVFFVFK